MDRFVSAGKPVDTTAAGDTFTGYFFTAIGNGQAPEEALRIATRASDTTVTRKGAAESIPYAGSLKHNDRKARRRSCGGFFY